MSREVKRLEKPIVYKGRGKGLYFARMSGEWIDGEESVRIEAPNIGEARKKAAALAEQRTRPR